MNPNDPNVAMMELVAARLGEDLRRELVFVGGAVAGLLITDPGQPASRPTEDVDLIVRAARGLITSASRRRCARILRNGHQITCVEEETR